MFMFIYFLQADNHNSKDVVVKKTTKHEINGTNNFKSILTIYDTNLDDTGLYSCTVSDVQGHEETGEAYVVIHGKFLNALLKT